MSEANAEAQTVQGKVVQGSWGRPVPAREFLTKQLASLGRQETQAAATLEQARGARQMCEYILERCGADTTLLEPTGGKPEEKPQ